jgi:hypothetical protein
MSQLEDLIRDALRHDEEAPPEAPGMAARVTDLFLRRSRWVAALAWMKMGGTLAISVVAGAAFFGAESTRGQILCATLVVMGFVGFATWWIWYWMVLNRNAALRELKRIELQLAELRAHGRQT